MKLPVLAARAPETTLCTYCPKLCRPACPVSTVEGRETVTPWGKMRAMGELIRAVAPADDSHFAPAFACTGCMHCLQLCDLDNPVAETLRDGKVEAFEHGALPEGVRAFVSGFDKRESNIRSAAEAIAPGNGGTAFVPGCTAVVFDGRGVARVAEALGRLDAACTVVADVCCGLPLLEAGDRNGFVTRARKLSERVSRFDGVITSDAGCAHAMRVLYKRAGVLMPRISHLAEVAAASIRKLPPLAAPPEHVVYHDACRLGRGLNVYDEPRAVLTRLLGRAPGELRDRRERGLCSGGGGLLPLSRRTTAHAIAQELASEVAEVSGETVVTACATSVRMLRRAGTHAVDFGELIAQAFGVAG